MLLNLENALRKGNMTSKTTNFEYEVSKIKHYSANIGYNLLAVV
jgi:hypothetical protein